MRLPKDILNAGLYTKPNFFLCETDKEKICKLETTETKGSFKFNSMSELSFETARVYNDIITGETKVNPFFDKIEALRLVYVEGFGYFELQGPELIADGIEEKKSCTAYSLEYTLAQKYLENFYVNMGTVESIEVINASSEKNIVPITLYNPSNPKLSLLHLVLEEIYGWRIGHVDSALQTLSRQFEIDRESVYDFLMNEVCEKFNCYIVFDTINNTINVYAESLTAKFIGDGHTNTFTISPPFSKIGTVSVDGYKTTQWEYNIATGSLTLRDTPDSGSHIEVVDGALTEWETDVFISFDNLAQEANINYDADSIKTRLTVTYGDDYDIREVNLGLPYLTDISYYYTMDWMGQDLYDAYTKYMQKSNNSQSEYTKNSQEILKWNDYIAYEENRLSLEYSLVESVNSATVGIYYTRHENLDGSYYYSEVSLPTEYIVGVDYYSNVTTNVNEEKVRNLYTVLQKYFYSYFNGEADGISNALTELKELLGFEFMETYTLSYLHNSLKDAASVDEMDAAIYNFLSEIWVELGRTPLKELYLKPYKVDQETNIKAGWSNKTDKNYGNYYPVVLFINSIESAIAERDATIGGYKAQQKVYQDANAVISNSLLMRNNFTEAQLIRLSAFLREDELHLDDIVETSLDDLSSSFKIKQDAMESGRIELQKLCQPQLQFSMTMANIYALPEFDPIINQFQLGRVIRVCLRQDYIKQSRLLQVDINFDDFSDFSCEFGELTSLRTQSDIHADLLSQAITAGKSVATNSSYWTRGSDTATSTDLKIQQGLLDATTQIKAIDGTQGVVIDKYGIKLQKKLDNGEIDPHQTWLVNNMILMSDDGFKTSRSALGEVTVDGQTYYGIISELVLSGYIEGSKIVGGTIQIGEYLDEEGNKKYAFEVDKDGDVTMTSSSLNGYVKDEELKEAIDNTTAEFKITTDSISSEVQGIKENYATTEAMNTAIEQSAENVLIEANTTLTETLDDYSTTSEMEAAIKVSADGITNQVNKTLKDNYSTTTEINSAIKQSADAINLEVRKKVGSDEVISKINQSSEEISISASKIKFEGLVTANNNFKILTDGSVEAKNAIISGEITADTGSIGSWQIGEIGSGWGGSNYPNSLYSVTKIDSTDYLAFLRIPATDTGNVFAIRTRDSDGKVSTPFYVNKNGAMYADNATIKGAITATSLTLGSNASISAGKVTGLSTVATSGRYDDLTGKPTIPTNVGQLGLDTSTIIFKGDITQSTKKDTNGIEYVETVVPSSSGTIKYSTYDADDYIVFGRSKGTNSSGKDYVCISKEGLLTARNALIYGTIYATDGEFTGKITSESGSISGWNLKDNSIYNSGSDDWSENGTFMCTGTRGTYTIGGGKANNWVFGAGGAFGVTKSGAVWCSDIHATGGAIASWNIDENSIYSNSGTWESGTFMCTGSSGSYSIGGSAHLTNWVFGAGGKFGVTKSGSVWCSDLQATGGNIGPWYIGQATITNVGSISALHTTYHDGNTSTTVFLTAEKIYVTTTTNGVSSTKSASWLSIVNAANA